MMGDQFAKFADLQPAADGVQLPGKLSNDNERKVWLYILIF